MKQWRSLIVDDEPFARLELTRLLADFDQITIVGEAGSVPEAQEKIECLSPELIFLDIDLGQQSGFDLLELLENNFQTIFVTAFDEFAIRAFEVNALDYLLKPVNPSRLNDSISRLGNPYREQPSTFLKPYDKILINTGRSNRFITVNSIEYIEANGDYTNIFTTEGVKGTLHHTIKKWSERLPSTFCQVHRSYIVNTNQVEKVIKKENSLVDLILKQHQVQIPVSRKFKKNLKTHIS